MCSRCELHIPLLNTPGDGNLIFFSATFAGTLTGDFLPMQLIYGGKTYMCHPKYTFPAEFDITHSENHWANSETMTQ